MFRNIEVSVQDLGQVRNKISNFGELDAGRDPSSVIFQASFQNEITR